MLLLLAGTLTVGRHLHLQARIRKAHVGLGELRDEADRCRTPEEFLTAINRVKAYKEDVEDLAGSPLATGLHALRGRPQEAMEQISFALGQAIEHDYAADEAVGDVVLRALKRLETLATWATVLAAEASVSRDLSRTSAHRLRGKLALPALGSDETRRVYRQHSPLLDQRGLEVIHEGKELEPGGLYLLQHFDSEGLLLGETNFEYEFAAPFKEVELEPYGGSDPDPFRRMTAGTFRYELERDAPFEIEIAAFELMPRPVTWGELCAVLPEEGLTMRYTTSDPPTDDAPAEVSWDVACRYAAAVGARLPRVLELLYAFQQGDLQPPEGPTSELTSDKAPLFMQAACLDYKTLGSRLPLHEHLEFNLQHGKVRHSCFRLARTVDDE